MNDRITKKNLKNEYEFSAGERGKFYRPDAELIAPIYLESDVLSYLSDRAEANTSMPFRTSRVVLFGDCDPAGFVYTPRVAHFVVEAALEFLSHALEEPAARRLLAMGIFPPARSLSIDFLHPMVWDEKLDIEVSVEEIRERSFSLLVTAQNAAEQITFRATLVQVCVSPESKRPVALPTELRSALESVREG